MSSLQKVLTEYKYTFLLAVAVFICYFNLPLFQFQTGWDDHWVAINYYTERGFTFENLTAILQDFYHGQYAPINQLYYTSIYSLFGYNAGAFHLAGLIVHLFNVIAVFYFIVSLSQLAFEKSGRDAQKTAFISALLFAVHPVNVEPTAWIAASKILLYSFFYLLALIAYLGYIRTKKPIFFYLCIFLFIISFGAKEQAVSMPLCLLMLDYICGRNMKEYTVYYEKLPFLILSVHFGMVSISSQGTDETRFYYTYGMFERLALAGYTLTEYLTKCVIPVKLSYLYPFPFEPNESWPVWIWVYPFAIITTIVTLGKFLAKKWVLFACLFFLIHVVIVLNLLNINRYAVVADRYAYLSSVGICFLFSYSYHLNVVKGKTAKNIATCFLFTIIAGFAIYSHYHSYVWKNTKTLKMEFKNTISGRKDFSELKNKISSNDEK